MFNTPILDIFLGLVLIFLLYSLLATSLKEGIATVLGLRARMLRKGIIIGMLTATPDYTHWWDPLKSFFLGIWSFLKEAIPSLLLLSSYRNKDKKTLGGQFYAHPILKNYGSSGLYPYPSYLPANNFSTILVDTLKKDFLNKINPITISLAASTDPATINQLKDTLIASPDIDKIRQLLQQYRMYFTSPRPLKIGITAGNYLIDEETLSILELYLIDSGYNMDAFNARLEDWFNDSMNRVSGWYKRQVQVILFFIGMAMAITFNIDVIDIATKLSKDDKLRVELISSASAYSQAHRGPNMSQDHAVDFTKESDDKFQTADSLVNHDIHDVNSLMALGYGDYGARDSLFIKELKDMTWHWGWFNYVHTSEEAASIRRAVENEKLYTSKPLDSVSNQRFFEYELKTYPFHVRKAYISYLFWWKRKMLGFFILALAVCLGAPFWFDMLSKVMNLRPSGKKEGE